MSIDELLRIDCPVCSASCDPLADKHCTTCGTPFEPQYVESEIFKNASSSGLKDALDEPIVKAVLVGCVSGFNWLIEESVDNVSTEVVPQPHELVSKHNVRKGTLRKKLLWGMSCIISIMIVMGGYSTFSRDDLPNNLPHYVLKNGVSGLNLRSNPSVRSEVLTIIIPGEKIQMIEMAKPEWMKVKLDRVGYGFIVKGYVKKLE